MMEFSFKDNTYHVDSQGFLVDRSQWNEDFARGMASELKIANGLSKKHWEVLNFIRKSFKKTGKCPLIYETCKAGKLTLRGFKDLFPTGYLRGACLLAGITYKDRVVNYFGEPGTGKQSEDIKRKTKSQTEEKIYRIDAFGFLVDASEWDEDFCFNKADEMRMTKGLTEKHWKVIYFLREHYKKTGVVPNVIECCEKNRLSIEGLEKLFPAGYHRGAVKMAGLRFR